MYVTTQLTFQHILQCSIEVRNTSLCLKLIYILTCPSCIMVQIYIYIYGSMKAEFYFRRFQCETGFTQNTN
jgi:hypothetical protein